MYRINDAYTTWIQLYHFDVIFEVAFYIPVDDLMYCTTRFISGRALGSRAEKCPCKSPTTMILHRELWDLKVVVHELLGETRLELDSIFIFQDIF